MAIQPIDVLILGGACIDLYEDPTNPGKFLPARLGGDAANVAVTLAEAAKHGWPIGKVTLAALVGTQPYDGAGIPGPAPGGDFILQQLRDVGVHHDPGFCHEGIVRTAVWEYDAQKGKHVLNQSRSFLVEPIEQIANVAPHPVMQNGGIILAASMPTTLGWNEYYQHTNLENYPRTLHRPVVISSFNKRAIEPKETIEYKGEKYLKAAFYDKNYSSQLIETNVAAVSTDNLPHMYPDTDADSRMFELMDQTVNDMCDALIVTDGANGFSTYFSHPAKQSIHMPAPMIDGAIVSVGAGAGLLTGIVLGLVQAGAINDHELRMLNKSSWQGINRNGAHFSKYRLEKQNGRTPVFPVPLSQTGFMRENHHRL